MKDALKRISLNKKIIILALVPFFIFTSILISYSFYTTEKELINEKQNQIRDVTTTALKFLHVMDGKVKNGEYTLKQAQAISKEYISEIRYGDHMDDYLWVNDLQPKMLVHPKESLRETDVGDFQDKSGGYLFRDIVELVNSKDKGFINYTWYSKNDQNSFVEKYSYVELFKPWGWVLGTGIYVESVHEHLIDVFIKNAAITLVGLILMTILFAVVIKASITDPLMEMAAKLRNTSKQVATGSKSTHQTSTQLSAATNEQAASLQETVASVDEISSMIRRNTEFAEESKISSQQSETEVQNGKITIDHMLQAIEEIADNNSDAMKKMGNSNDQIQDILKIIKEIEDKTQVINDIVFQTKLLSFNASVEAARSGESGKGFAVVAEEIGSLASMSGAASEEIRTLIENSIKNVEKIVGETTHMVKDVMENSTRTVENGRKHAADCKEVLDKIVFNVQNVNGKITEITSACHEQTQGVNEITNAIRLIDETTMQNNNSAQEASKSAAQLKGEADNLNNVVSLVVNLVTGKEDKAA